MKLYGFFRILYFRGRVEKENYWETLRKLESNIKQDWYALGELSLQMSCICSTFYRILRFSLCNPNTIWLWYTGIFVSAKFYFNNTRNIQIWWNEKKAYCSHSFLRIRHALTSIWGAMKIKSILSPPFRKSTLSRCKTGCFWIYSGVLWRSTKLWNINLPLSFSLVHVRWSVLRLLIPCLSTIAVLYSAYSVHLLFMEMDLYNLRNAL